MRAVVRQGKATAEVDTGSSANLADTIGQALGLPNVRAVGVNAYPRVEDGSLVMRFDVFYDRGRDGTPSDLCQVALHEDAAVAPPDRVERAVRALEAERLNLLRLKVADEDPRLRTLSFVIDRLTEMSALGDDYRPGAWLSA